MDGGVDAFNILRVAHDDMHARSLQLLDLLVGLGHGAHEQDLRLQLDDLLDVGVAAGLDSRDLGHFRRIVAVFAAADQQIARADGVEDLAVRRGQGNDAGRGLVQGDLPAGHVGQGHGGGLLRGFFGRFFGGFRFFGGRRFFGRSGLGLRGFGLRGLGLCGAAGQDCQQHHGRQQQGKDLILFHGSVLLYYNINTKGPSQQGRA